jgi:hypothetical protein
MRIMVIAAQPRAHLMERVLNALRDYMSADSKFVVVGGETCSDDYSPANDCEPAGQIAGRVCIAALQLPERALQYRR